MTRSKKWAKARFAVHQSDGTFREIVVEGRVRWALECLILAGAAGCTPIDHPGPRWSAYVFKLRRKYGLTIETITEAHDGPFSGHHARYVLRCHVTFLGEVAQ